MARGSTNDRLGGWYPVSQDKWAYNLPNGEQNLLIFDEGESLEEQVEYIRLHMMDPAFVQSIDEQSRTGNGFVHLDGRGNATGIRPLGSCGHGSNSDRRTQDFEREHGRPHSGLRQGGRGNYGGGDGGDMRYTPDMVRGYAGGGRRDEYRARGEYEREGMRDEDSASYQERLLREADELIDRTRRQIEGFNRRNRDDEGLGRGDGGHDGHHHGGNRGYGGGRDRDGHEGRGGYGNDMGYGGRGGY